ncbi:MAG TPA: RNA polymerase sigma factor [Alphaproteobacteria bacterium]|nr:RNA polymerase sigma factor [Alphaproteobacteria bacterium]
MPAQSETQRAIEAVWRIESPRLIAGLTRIVRDISMAEDLAMDALAVALRQWPDTGVPQNAGAWLMTTAKRRAIDYFRRNKMAARKLEELGAEMQEEQDHGGEDPDARLDDEIGDDLLRLMFTSCHPILSMEARVALTLRLIGGLTTEEIARAYLVPEPTVAQRIVRAKRTIAEARIPYEVPRGEALKERLAAVLGVIYLIFNEGYSATSGDNWMRPQLCNDALRLGRILAELTPREREVHGLVALMEIQASRQRARTAVDGTPILLLEQDRSKWDWLLVRRGLAALERAEALGGRRGPYELQAAIAACHGRARRADETDWRQIADLYDELAAAAPSPIVELNRAVAYAFAYGPTDGLDIVDQLLDEPTLGNYHLLPSVRGDLLQKLGRLDEARREFQRAATMTRNARERTLLEERAAACAAAS